MNILNPEQARQARETLGLSQSLVSKETGISRAYISQYETGHRILEDTSQETLNEFYISQGWNPTPTPKGVTNEDPSPFILMDGMLIVKPESESNLEALIDEYYENDELIAELRNEPVESGWLLGGLDREGSTEKALPLLALYARQYQIKETLQGRLGDSSKLDGAEPKTIGDFVDLVLTEKETKSSKEQAA